MSGEGEFEYIRRRLAPLSAGWPGADHLRNDGAVIQLAPGEALAVTADVLVEGRHFPVGEDPALAARKALRVNVSDLAAMGAEPRAYMTSVVWPEDGVSERAEGFAEGLAADQARYGIHLIGGDTTQAATAWTISVTAFGAVSAQGGLTRSGAKAGDVLVVTGTIGDAWLGLKAVEGRIALSQAEHAAWVLERFRLPEPRIAIGRALHGVAHAAIDVSDGLLADVRHMAIQSGLHLTIDLDAIPRSTAAEAWLSEEADRTKALCALAAGGDDYELAFAVAEADLGAVLTQCEHLGVRTSVIGRFEAGPAQVSIEREGAPCEIEHWGFTHF